MRYKAVTLHENYEYICPFREERAVVYSTGREMLNFIDPGGRTILPEWYPHRKYISDKHFSTDFAGGYIALPSEGGKFGYMDRDGNTALPFIYEKARSFIDGVACVRINGKYGLIDKTGSFVVPLEYDMLGFGGFNVQFFEDKLFACKGGKGGFINRAGETVIPFDLDVPTLRADEPIFLPEFGDGLVAVRRGGRAIIIDTQGNEVLPVPDGCTGAGGFVDGLTFISFHGVGHDYHCRIMHRDGSWLPPPEYNAVGLYRCGRIQVERDGKLLFIDRNGTVVIDGDYTAASDFFHGRAWVQKNGKWGAIDPDGKVVVPIELDYVSVSPSGCMDGISIHDGKKYGFADGNGSVVIPLEYDDRISWYGRWSVTKKNGQWVILHIENDDDNNNQ